MPRCSSLSIQTVAALGCFFLAVAAVTLADDAKKNAKIVVIGAGAAGIAAASKLFENGFHNVTVLEAAKRIGGRLYTDTEGINAPLDFGARWVNGQEGNVVYDLANPLNLLGGELGIKYLLVDSQGDWLDDDVAKKLLTFLDEDLEPDNDTVYESYGQFTEKKFDEKFQNDPKIMKDKSKYTRLLESLVLELMLPAESWFDLSTSEAQFFYTYPGEQQMYWKTRGYSTILEILMKEYPPSEPELPVRNNTVLSTEVTSINYSNLKDDSPILITTKNGKLYEADHVIVTVSLGVLKETHQNLFIPPLPADKVSAIEAIGFANTAVIYLQYNYSFWGEPENSTFFVSFIYNDQDKEKLEAEPEKNWLLGMGCAMTVESIPNVLTIWVTGKYARAMGALSAEKVFLHVKENLRRFLEKTYPNMTDPDVMLRVDWYTNPYIRGASSYRSVETDKRGVFPETLEKPVQPEKMAILFAGEATDNNRYGTVDGAIRSGWKAAARLIDYYKNKS